MRTPAARYVEAYNRYQTRFAYRRLQGWDGLDFAGAADVKELHDAMVVAFRALHEAVTGESQPNYVERAKRQIIDESRS